MCLVPHAANLNIFLEPKPPEKRSGSAHDSIIVVHLLSVSSSTGTIGGSRGYFTRNPSPGETEFLAFP